jgi:head-tail adaptor
MRIAAGELDRRIIIMRPGLVDDGTATVPGGLAEIGRRRAKKTDVSDGERVRAAEQSQDITTRFLVRSDALTRTITGKDVVIYRGRSGDIPFEVVGTKESIERDDGIEITATARPDAGL